MLVTFDSNVPGLAESVCSLVRNSNGYHRWCQHVPSGDSSAVVCDVSSFRLDDESTLETLGPDTLHMFYDTPLVASIDEEFAMSRTLFNASRFVNFVYVDHRVDNAALRALAKNLRRACRHDGGVLDRLVTMCNSESLSDATYRISGIDRCGATTLPKALARIVESFLIRGYADSPANIARHAAAGPEPIRRVALPLPRCSKPSVRQTFDLRDFIDATCATDRTVDCASCAS